MRNRRGTTGWPSVHEELELELELGAGSWELEVGGER
jgi:hypothetical protein